MDRPKTLLELAGARPVPAGLSEAVLVIIDAQNEYRSGALPLARVEGAIGSARRLLDRARDTHTPVIHVVHRGRPGGLFDPDESGGAILDDLTPRAGEAVVAKTLPNCFTSDEFRRALVASARKKIVAVGFMTHMCVEATARSALDHGYATTVVSAATATRDLPDPLGGPPVSAEDVQRRSLAAIADRFATVVEDENAVG